jgi:FkbM family methyltransferase
VVVASAQGAHLNKLYFRILWLLTAPVRAHLRASPLRQGAGRIAALLVYPVMRLADKDMSYHWVGAAGARFQLRFREEIGQYVAAFGSFEGAELVALLRLVDRAGLTYDVGANIGIFTVPLGISLGASGKIVAFEPYPPNVARLRAHLTVNNVLNVDILPVAASDFDGEVELRVGTESARATTASGVAAPKSRTLIVPCQKLDSVWRDSGEPMVALMKIDVEGSEVAVVRGASRLIESCRPVLLIESVDKVEILERLLSPYGYRRTQPDGFMPWNHLFETP